jgi:putative ATPase
VVQQYLPEHLSGQYFYKPSDQGYEAEVKQRVEAWRKLQKEGLTPQKGKDS